MNAQLIIAAIKPAVIHERKIFCDLHRLMKKIVKQIVANAPASLDQPAIKPNGIISQKFSAEFDFMALT